ncbi:MAG: hypothetical protein ACIAS6_03260 [Phycisphaerales bacterium JB060]
MSRVPDREQEFLNWSAAHLAIWAGQGVAPTIGMTPEQVAAAQLKLDQAQAAWSSAEAVRLDSVTKTEIKDQKMDSLRTVMGGLVGQVDGFARATEDQSVYTKASIPKPKDRTPRTDAPVPTDLDIRSTTNGNLRLTFEANKGQGMVFVIQRSYETVDGVETSFQYVDTTADKAWTDTSVPNGLKWIGYQVASRLTNNVLSDWSPMRLFNFGTAGNQNPASAQATSQSGGGGEGSGGDGPGGGVTIEDAQALKDAQTAKGKGQAG